MGRFFLYSAATLLILTVTFTWSNPAWSAAKKSNWSSESGRHLIQGIDFYRLAGTPQEMGRQMGEYAPLEARKDGMPIYMAGFLDFFADAIPLTRGKPWLMPLVDVYFDQQYYRHMRAQIPPADREVLKALASGLDYQTSAVEKMFMNPDVSHMIVAEHWEKTESLYHELSGRLLSQAMGCTSFITGLDGRGEMLFSRTFDYSGVGHNDKYPSVFFIATEGKYKYISLASAGTAPAVTHAINEHGLTLSLQNAFSNSVFKKGGHSIFTVNRLIMEEARSIEEAGRICQQNMPATSWLIILADTIKGYPRAGRLEVDPVNKKCHLVWAEQGQPAFVTTNFFTSKEARQVELELGPGVMMDLRGRHALAHAMIDERLSRGQDIGLNDAVEIMGSRYSWELKRKGAFLPGSISVQEQIGSFIVKPMTKEIWIANGAAPTNSTGQYVHFRFSDLDVSNWQDFRQGLEQRFDDQSFFTAPILQASGDSLEQWPASQALMNVYRLVAKKKIKPALQQMDRVVSLVPDEPIYWLVRGMLHFKAEEFDLARIDFSNILRLSPERALHPYRQSLAQIFLAKSLDILGEREKSLQIYRQLAENSDTESKIRAAAQAYLLKPYPRKEARWIAPHLQFLTVFKH